MKGLLSVFRENKFFFLPFCFWLGTGAILLHFCTKPEVFLFVNAHHDRFFDYLMGFMTYLAGGWALVIISLILLGTRRFKAFWLLIIAFLASGAVAQILKMYYHEPRPALYFEGKGIILHSLSWVPLHKMNSFPSGHSTAAFSIFCFLALIVNNKRWGGIFFFLAFLAAYSRVYLSQHFLGDVYAGSIIGTFVTLAIYCLSTFHRSKNKL